VADGIKPEELKLNSNFIRGLSELCLEYRVVIWIFFHF